MHKNKIKIKTNNFFLDYNAREIKNDNSPTNDSYNGIDQLLNASIYTSEKRLQYET